MFSFLSLILHLSCKKQSLWSSNFSIDVQTLIPNFIMTGICFIIVDIVTEKNVILQMFWQNNKGILIRRHFTIMNYNFEIREKAEQKDNG